MRLERPATLPQLASTDRREGGAFKRNPAPVTSYRTLSEDSCSWSSRPTRVGKVNSNKKWLFPISVWQRKSTQQWLKPIHYRSQEDGGRLFAVFQVCVIWLWFECRGCTLTQQASLSLLIPHTQCWLGLGPGGQEALSQVCWGLLQRIPFWLGRVKTDQAISGDVY